MSSLDSDLRYDANDDLHIRPSNEPGSQNNGGESSEIGSENEVKNIIGQDGDHVACKSQAQTNRSDDLSSDLDASCLNHKSRAGEKLMEESGSRQKNKEVELHDESSSAVNQEDESLCDSLAVNFSTNSLSKESYLAVQSTNDEDPKHKEQPMKCKDEIIPPNESKRLLEVEVQLHTEYSTSNQAKSKTFNDDNEDVSHVNFYFIAFLMFSIITFLISVFRILPQNHRHFPIATPKTISCSEMLP